MVPPCLAPLSILDVGVLWWTVYPLDSAEGSPSHMVIVVPRLSWSHGAVDGLSFIILNSFQQFRVGYRGEHTNSVSIEASLGGAANPLEFL